MLTLYQYPGGDGLSSVSPPCMKVEMALRLVGADYGVKNITSPAKARRISVTGRLPVLEVDGERTPDSIAILDRLERDFPESPLWPTDPARRLRDRLWDHFGTDSLYWLGFYQRWVRPDTAARTYQALFGRMPAVVRAGIRLTFVPRQRKRAALHGVGGKPAESVHEEMVRAMDLIVGGLEGGPFLQGRNHPGRGDLACSALLVQAGFRETLPESMEQIRRRPPLPELCRRTLEACTMRVPDWLQS